MYGASNSKALITDSSSADNGVVAIRDQDGY